MNRREKTVEWLANDGYALWVLFCAFAGPAIVLGFAKLVQVVFS